MAFNENTRVKIPAILHLCRLGYEYIPLSKAEWDEETNIFKDIFLMSMIKINKEMEGEDIAREYQKLVLTLDNEDLGKEFYEKLTTTSGMKLIDFQNLENNSYHVVTELTYKNSDDEFRPDLTLLINGIPLAFIEVKKPNNREGILAERNRINVRFKNEKFRRFINISQLLVFSNNMEYDNDSIDPVQGAFYATTSHGDVNFNRFREEEKFNLNKLLKPEDDEFENLVLKDNNLSAIKHSPEFITNKDPESPTNRLLTSLFSKERLAMILRYSIAYVNEESGLEKHIMRYPQFFASKAIEKKLDKGINKGIIWHTQGSGKTALAFYNVHYLTDYFQKKNTIPKFYFIVDRIDLMIQAKREFTARGIKVHTVSSKAELLREFKVNKAIYNLHGQREITVVNIQKFKEDKDILEPKDYDVNIQRVYFLDEVHRSYDPKGSFLANLVSSDRNAILIGLTGTPLIGNSRKSRDIFGDYIHKYYYNASIADGYTLKLIREGIETNYKIQLEEALKKVEILKGDVDKRILYAHKKFVEPMLEYIVEDFKKSRLMHDDNTIGGMVVCDSSDQAKKMFVIFNDKYQVKSGKNKFTSALILHDVDTKDERKDKIEDFKAGKIDMLFVYNMLLTGFDAKRLKKLYIGRVIKDHNLLQTLTRVNRPYKNFRFGYVVDFADIRKEFDATNKAYFDELQSELGSEIENYSNLFMSKEEIESEIDEIKEKLFHFDLQNSEIFSQQISKIEDRKKVLEIKKALDNVKNLYNIIRLLGYYDLLDKIDFKKLGELYNETSRHLDLINLKETLENDANTANLLNVAMENVIFMFKKVSEEELVIADKLKDSLRKTQEALAMNFDKKDREYIALYDELRRLFQKKKLDEITHDDMVKNIGLLQNIYDKITELNRRNNLLKAKYDNDVKYARLHKRMIEGGKISKRESIIHETLMEIKEQADEKVLKNSKMLDNHSFFVRLVSPMVVNGFEKRKINLDPESAKYINKEVAEEYINEYNDTVLC